MRRRWSALLGSVVIATSVGLAPIQTSYGLEPRPTEFQQVFLSELRPVVAGQVVGFEATLVSGETPVVGATVSLLARPYGAPDFAVAATTTTDAEGEASVELRLNRSTAIRWHFEGSVVDAEGFDATTSDPYTQGIASRVRIVGSDRALERGQRLLVTGTTFPLRPGKKVLLMRGKIPYPLVQSEAPTVIGRGVVRADGSLRISTRFSRSGPARIFVTVAGGDGNTRGYSNYLRVRVR